MSARRTPNSNREEGGESMEGATRWEINRGRHLEMQREG